MYTAVQYWALDAPRRKTSTLYADRAWSQARPPLRFLDAPRRTELYACYTHAIRMLHVYVSYTHIAIRMLYARYSLYACHTQRLKILYGITLKARRRDASSPRRQRREGSGVSRGQGPPQGGRRGVI